MIGKKIMKFKSVCISNSSNLFLNVWGRVPRSAHALCSSCHKSQQTCKLSHLRMAAIGYVEQATCILGFFPLSVAGYHLQECLFKKEILGHQIQMLCGFFLRGTKKRFFPNRNNGNFTQRRRCQQSEDFK